MSTERARDGSFELWEVSLGWKKGQGQRRKPNLGFKAEEKYQATETERTVPKKRYQASNVLKAVGCGEGVEQCPESRQSWGLSPIFTGAVFVYSRGRRD